MRVFWTIIWSFLLSSMVTYVISNMSGGSFDITQAIVLAVAFTVISILLTEGAMRETD